MESVHCISEKEGVDGYCCIEARKGPSEKEFQRPLGHMADAADWLPPYEDCFSTSFMILW